MYEILRWSAQEKSFRFKVQIKKKLKVFIKFLLIPAKRVDNKIYHEDCNVEHCPLQINY